MTTDILHMEQLLADPHGLKEIRGIGVIRGSSSARFLRPKSYSVTEFSSRARHGVRESRARLSPLR
jgi:hypothetical protein